MFEDSYRVVHDYALYLFLAHLTCHFIHVTCAGIAPKSWAARFGESFPQRYGLFVNSFLHSTTVTLASVYFIARCGLILPSEGTVKGPLLDAAALDANGMEIGTNVCGAGIAPRAEVRPFIAISVAYFLYDLVVTLPDWRRYPADLLHHVLGVALTASCLLHPMPASLGQHILLTEASTPIYNITYVMKKVGADRSPVYRYLCIAFAVVFAVTRPLYLTYISAVVWTAGLDTFVRGVPHVAVAMLLLTALNIHWFVKIVAMLLRESAKARQAAGGSASAAAAGKKAQRAAAEATPPAGLEPLPPARDNGGMEGLAETFTGVHSGAESGAGATVSEGHTGMRQRRQHPGQQREEAPEEERMEASRPPAGTAGSSMGIEGFAQ